MITPPSTEDVAEVASDLHFEVSEQELADFTQSIIATITDLAPVNELPAPDFLPHPDRDPGYRPSGDEDPHNAWITKCRVTGSQNGLLAGMTVGLKDTISLAGIELTFGSPRMGAYVPSVDASVVTRVLDAGATIIGKNNLTGAGYEFGLVSNPTAPEFGIGGSSSGCAAAVASGEVDIAIGADQAGSIRVPASFAGVIGLKPTHGLVPYTGIYGYDVSIDHTGPLTRSVTDCARALEAIAGRDGLDHRQPRDLEPEPYSEALETDISDLTVAVLREGFELAESDDDVNDVVYEAVDELDDLGADIREVSVPRHADAKAIVFSILLYGKGQTMKQNGVTTGFDGWYDTMLMESLGQVQESDLPASVKSELLLTEYLQRTDHGQLYGNAKNLGVSLRHAYDDVLASADALVVPTSPNKPPKFDEKAGDDAIKTGSAVIPPAINSGVFNITHHPAMSVPCGTIEGAPVGMMLVGKRFDESTLFRLAYTYEQHTDHGVPG